MNIFERPRYRRQLAFGVASIVHQRKYFSLPFFPHNTWTAWCGGLSDDAFEIFENLHRHYAHCVTTPMGDDGYRVLMRISYILHVVLVLKVMAAEEVSSAQVEMLGYFYMRVELSLRKSLRIFVHSFEYGVTRSMSFKNLNAMFHNLWANLHCALGCNVTNVSFNYEFSLCIVKMLFKLYAFHTRFSNFFGK